MRYVIQLINHKKNICKNLCECDTNDKVYGRLLYHVIYTADEGDILLAIGYGCKNLPDPCIIYRYENGVLYHQMWSNGKTIAEVVDSE